MKTWLAFSRVSFSCRGCCSNQTHSEAEGHGSCPGVPLASAQASLRLLTGVHEGDHSALLRASESSMRGSDPGSTLHRGGRETMDSASPLSCACRAPRCPPWAPTRSQSHWAPSLRSWGLLPTTLCNLHVSCSALGEMVLVLRRSNFLSISHMGTLL